MLKKVLIAAASSSIALGLFIYRYVKITNENKLEISDAKIISILEEIKDEYTPVFLYFYKKINDYISNSQGSSESYLENKENIYSAIKKEMEKSENEICQKKNINIYILKNWIKKNRKHNAVIRIQKIIQDALTSIFEGKCPEMDIQVPSNIDPSLYLEIYRKILSTTRHEVYKIAKEIFNNAKKEGKKITKLDIKEQKEILNEVSKLKIRNQMCKKYKIENLEGEGDDYAKLLRRVYFKFSNSEEFLNKINLSQKINLKILDLIFEGKTFPELEENPMNLNDEDFKVI